jgi:hypothetical protein
LEGGNPYLEGAKSRPGSIIILKSVSTKVAMDRTPRESNAKGVTFIYHLPWSAGQVKGRQYVKVIG